MQGNHVMAGSRGSPSQMLRGLGTLLEKGKAVTCKHTESLQNDAPQADQRESPGLTDRFSSKILGLCAPRRAARRDGGKWYEAGRETPGGQSMRKSVVWLARPPHTK